MRGFSSIFIGICLTSIPVLLLSDPQGKKTNAKVDTTVPAPPAAGIKVPGIQFPFANLKTEIEVPVPTPGTVTASDAVFVPGSSKDQVIWIDTKTGEPKPDPKSADAKPAAAKPADVKPAEAAPTAGEKPATDPKAAEPTTTFATVAPPAGASGGGGMGGPPKPLDPIAGVSKPCANALVAFGSLWVPNCGASSLTRHDTKTNKVTATLPIGAFDALNAMASTADGVWMFTDNKTTLSRIDPTTNNVVGELRLPSDCNDLVSGDSSLGVSCPGENRILRVNPSTNLVINRIEVAAGPRSAVFGAGSVWTLNQGDGSVSRVDAKKGTLTVNIACGIPGGGEIAYGEGFVWATIFQAPITQIDPATNTVVKQWFGAGGDSIRAGHGSVFLSNLREGNLWRLDPHQPWLTASGLR